ncbi:hypothetical protein OS493_038863 [Desmophyllum pertusum]|uniref:Uncharacterized protein n=1 Tax=Desmophyllum pertusum TaxID=174260 RepID=A0A9W9Y6U7_9CNID|nr:hypothetical protein OS493_038863 [Desmophyllum pertusum]
MLDGQLKKPGTIVSYLTSYELFLSALPSEQSEKSLPSTSSYSVSLLSTGTRMVPPTPPKALGEKQKEAIKRVFKEEILNGKKTTIEEAQRKCCTTAVLSTLTFSKNRVKQVVNHVNYLVATRPTVSPQDLPVAKAKVDQWAYDPDVTSTMSSGSRTREAWNETDVTLSERKFRHEPSLPTTTAIRGMLSSDTALNEILQRKGWQKVYDKLKNMYKKRQRYN